MIPGKNVYIEALPEFSIQWYCTALTEIKEGKNLEKWLLECETMILKLKERANTPGIEGTEFYEQTQNSINYVYYLVFEIKERS